MRFGLYDGDVKVLDLEADSEEEAKVAVRHAGFRNKSKMFELIKEE